MTSDIAPLTLSPELVKIAKLDADESVKWVGKPDRHAIVQWKRYRQIAVISTVVIAIVMFPTLISMAKEPFNPSLFFVMLLFIAFPWILIGMIGNYEQTMAYDTVYAITNKRAIIFVGRRMSEFRSVPYLDTVPRLSGHKDLVMDRIWSRRESSPERKRNGFLCLSEQEVEQAQPLLVAVLNPPLVRILTVQQDAQIFKEL